MDDVGEVNLAALEREYVDFFDANEEYKDRIRNLIDNEERRLIINVNDLRRLNPTRAKALLTDSFIELTACQNAVKRIVQSINPEMAKKRSAYFVAVEGSLGSHHVSPRTLVSGLLGCMVCVEGIVTKCSLVRPKISYSFHHCPATGKTLERRYADMTSLEAAPATSYPTKDDEGNILETEYGLCEYKDHQTWTIQEMPERAPAGQLPRSLDAIADDDLVDKVKPGDRVQVVGQYRCLPAKQGSFTNATFRTVLIVNHVQHLSKERLADQHLESEDVHLMMQLAKRKDIVDLLTRSIAPSICGHEYIKLAVLLLLLGGVERHLENGSRLRGDINVLLLGDPSVAKSQFLRFVLHCAPRAIATTGRGSSGVGLTAAVTTDPESNDRHLEAGAMVLADRGIVCIDEFDKMTDIDRTAIHEVMEQGRVSIAKAGIQAKLNARCSVLAAANPVYGRYDPYKGPMENIGMQDSLLSRFDLLFIILDQAEEEADSRIAEHVLRVHRYRPPGEAEGTAMPLQMSELSLTTEQSAAGPTPHNSTDTQTSQARTGGSQQVFESSNHSYGGDSQRGQPQKYLTLSFLQKYIQVARTRSPELTDEASEILAQKYCDLRNQETAVNVTGSRGGNLQRTQPITARTLETLIRLATAHAKARWSKKVMRKDAEAAANLISYAIFKEVLEKSKKRARHDGSDASDSEKENIEDEVSEGDEEEQASAAPKRPQRKRRNAAEVDAVEVEMVDLDAETVPTPANAPAEAPTTSGVPIGEVKTLIKHAFRERPDVMKLTVQEIAAYIQGQRQDVEESQIRPALEEMHNACLVMLADNDVFLL